MSTLTQTDEAIVGRIEPAGERIQRIQKAAAGVIFGQEQVIERTLVTILSGGHALLIGVPGLAKTLLVETLGKVLGLDAKRIQFTPDLMPADLIGTNVVLETPEGGRKFEFQQGPVFANVLLADEINRAPAKTQSALLEAMQERQVTIGDQTYPLDPLFLVMATQNPIGQEGTYPLPEAQVDRFMLKVRVGYPTTDEEWEAVWAAAITISESGNLLMMSPRAKDEADWMKHSADLVKVGVDARKAAESKNPEKVLEWGEQVYNVCTACHMQYITDPAE